MRGAPLRAGVLLLRLTSFQGVFGGVPVLLDEALELPLFDDARECAWFLQILRRMCAGLHEGLGRRSNALEDRHRGMLGITH